MLTFGDPNVCANYIFISIMIIWAAQCPRRAPYRIGAYGLLIAALVTTGSNSGILSLLVGGAVAALLGVYRRGGIVPVATMLAFLSLGGYLIATNLNFASIQSKAQASHYAFIRDGIGAGRRASPSGARFWARACSSIVAGERSARAPCRRRRAFTRSRRRSSRKRMTIT